MQKCLCLMLLWTRHETKKNNSNNKNSNNPKQNQNFKKKKKKKERKEKERKKPNAISAQDTRSSSCSMKYFGCVRAGVPPPPPPPRWSNVVISWFTVSILFLIVFLLVFSSFFSFFLRMYIYAIIWEVVFTQWSLWFLYTGICHAWLSRHASLVMRIASIESFWARESETSWSNSNVFCRVGPRSGTTGTWKMSSSTNV